MKEKYWWLTEESQAMLERGYLLPNQTVEEKLNIICKYAASFYKDEVGLKERFLEIFERGWCSLSSPIWANFGEDRGLPISCFSSFVPDDLDKIYSTLHEVAMMTKLGGGTSGYFGKLRPVGTPIKGGGISSGLMSFTELFDTTTKVVSQSGVRRGAFAAYLDINHPEIEEFLKIKDKGNSLQTINTAVSVSDEWMRQMKDGDKEKRELWAKILKSRREKGIPYIFFPDTANRNKPQIYKDTNSIIHSSNLCVSPNTKILTKEGYQIIGDLEGETLEVWNGEEWSEVTVQKTGENQKLLRVKTDSGYELDCTEYHKFYIQKGYLRGTGKNKLEIIEKRANELKPGDKLIKFELPIIEHGDKELKFAYENGFYSGDGCLTEQGQRIYLYGDKKNLLSRFSSVETWIYQPNQDRIYGHSKSLKDKFFIPDSSYSIKSRLEWLSGYLDADGTVTNNNGSQSLQVACVEKEFLKEIQLMLQELGCDSKVSLARTEGEYLLPKNDGSGDLQTYTCQEVYRLLINGNSLYKLTTLGLKCHRLKWDMTKPNRECSHFIKIESVEELPDLSDTYCFNEPKKHLGMFNGILTGQCSEIFLPTSEMESFVCCLMSMNLSTYDEWKNTDAVRLAVMILDAVMSDFIKKTKNLPYMQRAHNFAVRHRALGLGVLGWHSLLQQKMIPFESFEAQQLNTSIFKYLKEKSYEASIELGEKYGYAPIFEGVETTDTKRRNTTLMAIAPTTSSSSILGQVSPSIEPYASNYFVAGLAKGSFSRKNTELEKLLESKEKNSEDVWKNIIQNQGSVQQLDFLSENEKKVFKTFQEISPLAIIQQAAARQSFIDQGQSVNLKIPSSMGIKDINTIHMEAWELGLKSLYYQRGTSVAKEAVLEMMECKSCEG